MQILELFSGTKSISKVFVSHGWEAFTIDNNKSLNPELCIDILDFNISMLPQSWRRPNVIWASPPCTCFSVANYSQHNFKNGRPYTARGFIALALLAKSLEIIRDLKPDYFFIENPRGLMRTSYLLEDIPRKTATYCQYGADYQKPTDIWTNADLVLKSCNTGDSCHKPAPRGSKSGIQGLGNNASPEEAATLRGIIPPALCEEIFNACNRPPRQLDLRGFV